MLSEKQQAFMQLNQQRLAQSNSVVAIGDRNLIQAANTLGFKSAHKAKDHLNKPKKTGNHVSKNLPPSLDVNKHTLQSEYASMGRQTDGTLPKPVAEGREGYINQARFFYATQKAEKLGSHLPTVGDQNRLSSHSNIETSDDLNQVAEEDQSSSVKIRNKYLDEDLIVATANPKFKQEPKPGKQARPNPNLQPKIPQSVLTVNQILSPPLINPLTAKAQTLNRRIFDTNQGKPDQLLRPATQVALHGQNHLRKSSQVVTAQAVPSQAKTGARRIVSSSTNPPVEPTPGERFRPQTQIVVLPVQTKLATNQKPKEELTSSGRKKYPIFQRMMIEEPSNGIKQAMIHQFEMMHCGPKNGAAQVYQNITGQSGSIQGLMNKATLCDSTTSQKQNNTTGSNSQFLRKSLWLLTNSKSRQLKDLVQQKQQNCNLCQYIHSYQTLTVAANIGLQSASKAVHTQSIFQTQSAKNAMIQNPDNYFTIQGAQDLHRILVSGQMAGIDSKQKQASKLLSTDNSRPLTTQSKNLQFQSMPEIGAATLGSIQTNSRINLKIQSPKSPMSPGTPNSHGENYTSSRRQIRKVNNYQGSSLLSNSHGSANGYILTDNVHATYDGNGAVAQLQNELFDRFEGQYFHFLLKKILISKYMTSQEYYNSKVSSDIMYNEQRHIVSVFKEYLIYDDFSEYLKRFYSHKESYDRLPRIFEFYEHYSKVFPNYVALPESKYMFKNIERKQKLIDQRHQNFIRNQKRASGELSEKSNSALILFNSQFLKEVFEEPTMHGSMMQDPRDEISVSTMSRVLNNPVQHKQPHPRQPLNTSRNYKDLENIIGVLSKFERVEDNSIMAREVVSDSLFRHQKSDKPQGQIMLEGLFRDGKLEELNLSMSSWTQRSMVDHQMLQQDSQLELQSAILSQSIDLRNHPTTPKMPSGFPSAIKQMSHQKPGFENRINSKALESNVLRDLQTGPKSKKDEGFNHIKEFLNDQIVKSGTNELMVQDQAKLQQTKSIRGIQMKKITIGQPLPTEKDSVNTGEITRNQDKNQLTYTQQQTVLTSLSSLNTPIPKPGAANAAQVRETMVQKGMPKQEVLHFKQANPTVKLKAEQLLTQQLQIGDPLQKKINNLAIQANKINNPVLASLNSKKRSVVETRNLALDRPKVQPEVPGSCTSKDRSSSVDHLKPLRESESRSDHIQFLTSHDEFKQLQRLQNTESLSVLSVKSNQQKPANLPVKQKFLDDQLRAQAGYQLLPDNRRVKTSIEINEKKLNVIPFPPGDEARQGPGMKIEPPTYGPTKLARFAITSLGSSQTLQSKPFIERKKLLVKPSLEDISKTTKPTTSNVYQMIGHEKAKMKTAQMTPYALLSYYQQNHENTDSRSNLHQLQTFQSPEIKERISKSESVQKPTTRVKEEQFKEWTQKKTPQRTFKPEKLTQGMLAESATLAAVKHFQSNAVNPYDKTGRLQSQQSRVSENSGKGSARGTKYLVNHNIKGRNVPETKANKPLNSLSAGSLKSKVAPVVVMNTGISSSSATSALSNYSQKQMGGQVYQQMQSESDLFAMAKKISSLMKKGPLSTGSSSKAKKKSVQTEKNPQKTAKQGLNKKVMSGTQGHTIFAVSAKYASNF